MTSNNKLTYSLAGVDIEKGNEAVEMYKPLVKKTMRKEVLTGLGGFGGLFALDLSKTKNPVLVSGTDGVGTKLAVAQKIGRHDTIGIDCVAMCVNDIVVSGAEPLFFLDYLAVGKLEPEDVAQIVKGIAEGCLQAGCALIGGETAEMPGFYDPGEYDVAGFVVGMVDKEKIIDGSTIKPGDALIGISSSGLHSNGYSLARKIAFDVLECKPTDHLPELNCTIGDELLKPTRIYVQLVKDLLETYPVKGMVHVTGGGLIENPPRILPKGTHIELEYGSWPILPVFNLLQKGGNVDSMEMLKTFNMGIGFVLVVSNEEKDDILQWLNKRGEAAYEIGRVVEGTPGVTIRGLDNE